MAERVSTGLLATRIGLQPVGAQMLAAADGSPNYGTLETDLQQVFGTAADDGCMTAIAAVLILCGAVTFFAMMAWAGQHHS